MGFVIQGFDIELFDFIVGYRVESGLFIKNKLYLKRKQSRVWSEEFK